MPASSHAECLLQVGSAPCVADPALVYFPANTSSAILTAASSCIAGIACE